MGVRLPPRAQDESPKHEVSGIFVYQWLGLVDPEFGIPGYRSKSVSNPVGLGRVGEWITAFDWVLTTFASKSAFHPVPNLT